MKQKVKAMNEKLKLKIELKLTQMVVEIYKHNNQEKNAQIFAEGKIYGIEDARYEIMHVIDGEDHE